MSLRSLSDRQILHRIHELTRRERSITLAVLLHLNEIERRQLHLELGHASMFAYCTSGLGYSASAAARRIRTARCIARFPEVYALLEANEVNLTTIADVSSVLNPINKDRLLARIRGRSQAEVRTIVAEYDPRPVPRDSVRPLAVRAPVAPAAPLPPAADVEAGAAVSGHPDACEKSTYCRSGSACPEGKGGAEPVTMSLEQPNTASVEKYVWIQFAASAAFMARVNKIKSLAWHRLPANATLEQVFDLALDAFMTANDPEERRERREKRRDSTGTQRETASAPAPKLQHSAREERPRRHVPSAVRDDVFVRDRGRCTFVGADGRVCGSTRGLQLDHIAPVARGGAGTRDNLRLLCAYHNRLEAARLMGVTGPRGDRAVSRSLPLRQ